MNYSTKLFNPMKKESDNTGMMSTKAHGTTTFMGSVEKRTYYSKQKEEMTKSRILEVVLNDV